MYAYSPLQSRFGRMEIKVGETNVIQKVLLRPLYIGGALGLWGGPSIYSPGNWALQDPPARAPGKRGVIKPSPKKDPQIFSLMYLYCSNGKWRRETRLKRISEEIFAGETPENVMILAFETMIKDISEKDGKRKDTFLWHLWRHDVQNNLKMHQMHSFQDQFDLRLMGHKIYPYYN